MTNPPPDNPPPDNAPPYNLPHKRRWRWWHIPVALLLVLLLAFAGWHLYLSHRIASELARIRAEGYPVAPTELDAWYQYPEGENAADVYVRAFEVMVEPTDEEVSVLPVVGGADWPALGEPIPAEMISAIESYLAANVEAFKLLHEAGKIEGCRYPGYFGDVYQLNAYLGDTRRAAQLLALRALYVTRMGDHDAAVTAIKDMLAIARSLRAEPTLIGQLVQISIDALAVYTTQDVLNLTILNDGQLEPLIQALQHDTNDPGLERAFVGERVFGLTGYDNPDPNDLSVPNPLPPGWIDAGIVQTVWITLSRATGIWKLDELAYLDYMRKMINAVKANDLDASKVIGASANQMPTIYFVAQQIPPQFNDALKLYNKNLVSLDTARTALAAERYRLTHRQWPAQLQDLVPDYIEKVPLDPFNPGQPLRLIQKEGQLTVYSFGPNEVDDGGEKGGPSVIAAGDIIFTLERH